MAHKLLSLLSLTFLVLQPKILTAQNPIDTIFIGTYTDKDSKGIYSLIVNDDYSFGSLKLAASTSNPSFLTFSEDGNTLLAVNENSNRNGGGMVSSFKVHADSLIFINKQPSGGEHPCFVTVNMQGDVLTANYTSGSIGRLTLENNGQLSKLKSLQQHMGKSITERQKSPHAHSVYFFDDLIISANLGTDHLYLSKLNNYTDVLIMLDSIAIPPGSGPRHLAIHPNKKWIYVANELNNTVGFLQRTTTEKFEYKTTTSTLPDSFNKENYVADIHLSSDGKYLYVSNRGHNSIVVFAINQKTGYLTPKYFNPILGKWPRNFNLSPKEDYLIVANQHSNNLVLFKRDIATGLLTVFDEIAVPSPVCVLFKN